MYFPEAAAAEASPCARKSSTHSIPAFLPFIALLCLLVASLAFGTTAHAQDTSQALSSQGTIDADSVTGPRWIRIDFDSLGAADHTVNVSWDTNADVRFNIKRVSDNATLNSAGGVFGQNPGIWTGALEANQSYYISLWSAEGAANYTATVNIETNPPTGSGNVISQGIIDADSVTGPRWMRIDFDSLGTTDHTISVSWNTDADLRFNIKRASDNATLNSAGGVFGQNPGIWTGPLEADEQYYISLWSAEGAADFIATIETESNTPSDADNIISQGTIDSTRNTAPRLARFDFQSLGTGTHTINLSWDSDADVRYNVLGSDGSRLNASVIQGSNPGIWTGELEANQTYSISVWSARRGVANYTASISADATSPATPLTISSLPDDMSVNEGENASFSVAASGTGTLTYQWLLNGQEITGATSATFLISSVTLADAGTYRVMVTDQNDDVGYASAELTVNTDQPPSTLVSLAEGALDNSRNTAPRLVNIDFDALTTGSHTLSVSWSNPNADVRYIVRSSDGTNISGTVRDANPGRWTGDLVTDETYTMTLWVANPQVTDYSISLEASIALSILQRLSDLTVTAGENATFAVDAQSSNAITYQWYENNSPIAGATDSSLTVFSTTLNDDGSRYYVQVSDGSNTTRSNNTTLFVTAPVSLGLFSEAADTTAWSLEGPAPTLDFVAGTNSDGWGRDLLRVGDVLLVGGDFLGIKQTRNSNTPIINRPWLAALNAISGAPESTFQPPAVIDSVVRTLVLSPDKTQVFAGGDFGLVAMDAITGALNYHVLLEDRSGGATNPGRVFDIAVTNSEMYIGGDFTKVGNSFRANLARLSFDGVVDSGWGPNVVNGFSSGRGAPVQAVAVSTDKRTVYVGGNFNSIRVDGIDTFVAKTPQNADISMLSVSAIDETVQPERFSATLGNNTKALQVHDITTTDDFVIIAWGGPNFVSFHSTDGTLMQQYSGRGDVQEIEVVGDHVFVGHHGEFFGLLNNPIPKDAVVSRNPNVLEPYKLHSFRLNAQDMTVEPEQAWRITGAFGVWAISVSEDGLWAAGEISQAGSNEHPVEGLVRFPPLD